MVKKGKTHILVLTGVFIDDIVDEVDILDQLRKVDDFVEIENLENIEGNEDDFRELEKLEGLDEFGIGGLQEIDIDFNTFDSIPEYFVNRESWIKSTNLLCWYCNNKVEDIPWFIPISAQNIIIECCDTYENIDTIDYSPTSQVGSFNFYEEGNCQNEVSAIKVHGNFCSPFCVKKYINGVKDTVIDDDDLWQINRLLLKIYKELTGLDIIDIPEADDKTKMKQYCGKAGITIQEYKYINRRKGT